MLSRNSTSRAENDQRVQDTFQAEPSSAFSYSPARSIVSLAGCGAAREAVGKKTLVLPLLTPEYLPDLPDSLAGSSVNFLHLSH